MKQEINLEEILENSLKDYNNNGFYGISSLVGDQPNFIKEAMKEACNQVLDLAAENANLIEIYNAKDNGFNGAWDIVLDDQSILQIKDWIK